MKVKCEKREEGLYWNGNQVVLGEGVHSALEGVSVGRWILCEGRYESGRVLITRIDGTPSERPFSNHAQARMHIQQREYEQVVSFIDRLAKDQAIDDEMRDMRLDALIEVNDQERATSELLRTVEETDVDTLVRLASRIGWSRELLGRIAEAKLDSDWRAPTSLLYEAPFEMAETKVLEQILLRCCQNEDGLYYGDRLDELGAELIRRGASRAKIQANLKLARAAAEKRAMHEETLPDVRLGMLDRIEEEFSFRLPKGLRRHWENAIRRENGWNPDADFYTLIENYLEEFDENAEHDCCPASDLPGFDPSSSDTDLKSPVLPFAYTLTNSISACHALDLTRPTKSVFSATDYPVVLIEEGRYLGDVAPTTKAWIRLVQSYYEKDEIYDPWQLVGN